MAVLCEIDTKSRSKEPGVNDTMGTSGIGAGFVYAIKNFEVAIQPSSPFKIY